MSDKICYTILYAIVVFIVIALNVLSILQMIDHPYFLDLKIFSLVIVDFTFGLPVTLFFDEIKNMWRK